MTASKQLTSFSERSLTREQLITLVNTALSVNENKYARHLAVMWLSTYPGDLQVRLFHARSLLAEEDKKLHQQALQILEEVCLYDPEFVEAQKYLAKAQQLLNLDTAALSTNCVLALGGSNLRLPHGPKQHTDWAIQLREARRLLHDNEIKKQSKSPQGLDQAEKLIHQVLLANPKVPLAAVTHLRVIHALGTMQGEAIHSLAKAYHERWPKCLPVMLFYAHTSMEFADNSQAVSILHRAVSMDVSGQVASRIWGQDHPYQALWPDKLEIAAGSVNSPQGIPIPARVAAAYGWNRLPASNRAGSNERSTNTSKNINEASSTSAESNPPTPADSFGIADLPRPSDTSKNRTNGHRDGRFPIYVVLSTRKGLEQQYTQNNFGLIEEAMQHLVNAVRGRRIGHQNWGAMLFLADDPDMSAALGLKPARHNDPWSIKLALSDLDQALGKRGERIGALMIVGGPEVVPFHHLPNPVEDIDRDVPSDNPYGTRDENYFVLEWPVGRLPGGSDNDPGNLIKLLNAITVQHQSATRHEPWYRILWNKLLNWLHPKQKRMAGSLGYSAAVWRRASLAVFRSIGDPRSLLISPPVQACGLDNAGKIPQSDASDSQGIGASCLVLPSAQFGYFNLHGLSDSSEWYGQRDPTDSTDGPDFPIALRPEDIRNSGHAPRVVFSEACYGAYIHGKRVNDAISIKFLTSGTLAVVGSTSTCYGSISSPLIAADLLGRVYWGLISEGNLAGEALRRAKLYLAREMHQRQGYLDGEDQKTLISFVLYGDPLAQPYLPTHKSKLNKIAPELPSHLLTVSDQQTALIQANSPSEEITAHVKQVVKQYLPGMADAQMHINPSGVIRHAGYAGSDNRCTKKAINSHDRQVIILSKCVEQASQIHSQVARLTMDKTGKLVKLTVSR
jgi:hypothetical protein